MSISVRIPLSVLLLGLLPSVARPAAPPGGLDRAGDPLPRGGIARFGTERFRATPDIRQTLLSPDGRFLAVEIGPRKPSRGSIALFDAVTGKLLRSIPLPESGLPHEAASVLAFTPSGDRLAFLSRYDSALRLYDPAAGRLLHRMMQAEHLFAALAMDAKGTLLAVGLHRVNGGKALLEVYSLAAGKRIASFEPLHPVFVGLALSRDGKQLASWGLAESKQPAPGEIEGLVQLWDVPTGKELRRWKLPEPPAVGAFRGDGRELALAGASSVYLCDPAAGTVRKRFAGPSFRIFNRGRIRRGAIRHPPGSLTYSANGQQLLCATPKGEMRLVDLKTLQTLPSSSASEQGRFAVTLLPDGSFRACSADGSRLIVWDVRSGKQFSNAGHNSAVVGICFPWNGRLWTTLSSGELIEWARTGGFLRRNFLRDKDDKPLDFRGASLTFSPNGRHIASRSSDDKLILLDGASGKSISDSPFRVDLSTICRFSADGSLLVLTEGGGGLNSNVVYLIRPASGKELPHLSFKISRGVECLSAAPSPDGRQVAVLTPSNLPNNEYSLGRMHVCDAATGRRTAERRLSRGSIRFYGGTLAQNSPARGIHLWELASGKEVWVREVKREDAGVMVVTPDGRTLIAGRRRGTLAYHDLRPEGWRPPAHWSEIHFAHAWRTLGGDNPAKAYTGMWDLVACGDNAVRWLRQTWKPSSQDERVRRLLAELSSDHFAVREKARQSLEEGIEEAEPILRASLEKPISVEVKRTVQRLLARLDGPASPARLRQLRVLTVLERIGTPQARRMLQELGKGAGGVYLGEQARLAETRLAARALR